MKVKEMVRKWYIYGGILCLYFIVMLFRIWYIQQYRFQKSDLKEWVGEYTYAEASNEEGYPPMTMGYYIKIYERDHEYFADIEIDGHMTMTRIRAKVYGNREWISLLFLEYLPDHFINSAVQKGESVLLSFRNDGENIYTYWGAIEPMLYENEDSGEVYFIK